MLARSAVAAANMTTNPMRCDSANMAVSRLKRKTQGNPLASSTSYSPPARYLRSRRSCANARFFLLLSLVARLAVLFLALVADLPVLLLALVARLPVLLLALVARLAVLLFSFIAFNLLLALNLLLAFVLRW